MAYIRVENSDSLIIEPGVDIIFEEYAELDVYGILIASGNYSDSIRFTSGDSLASWGGLKAVAWADLFQGGALLVGGIVTFFLGLSACGGWESFSTANADKLHMVLDASHDGLVNITDAIVILSYLFTGGPAPQCMDAADVLDSGTVDISAAINLLNFLFLGGTSPRVPFPNLGIDPTDDALGCE